MARLAWLRDGTGRPRLPALEPVGIVLPLPPSRSRLPWAVENLRFCNWCDQHAQKDLNECPHCGRRGPVTWWSIGPLGTFRHAIT